MRTCTKCGIAKGPSFFNTQKNGKGDGLRTQCKACFSAYRAANRDRIKANKVAYEIKNRESIKAAKVDWCLRNLEKRRLYKAKYRAENPEKMLAFAQTYREKNREKTRASTRAWQSANKENKRVNTANRRARLRKAAGSHTVKDIKSLLVLQKYKCAICKTCIKERRHVDHVMPVAKGGGNGVDNLQLLCPACNIEKSDKHPIDYMQQRGYLL